MKLSRRSSNRRVLAHAAPPKCGNAGRDGRLGLGPVVEAALGGEDLERRLGSFPGRLGGRGLIPEPLGLAPQPVQRRAMSLARVALAGTMVELLLGRVGAIQGAAGRAQVFLKARPPSEAVEKPRLLRKLKGDHVFDQLVQGYT